MNPSGNHSECHVRLMLASRAAPRAPPQRKLPSIGKLCACQPFPLPTVAPRGALERGLGRSWRRLGGCRRVQANEEPVGLWGECRHATMMCNYLCALHSALCTLLCILLGCLLYALLASLLAALLRARSMLFGFGMVSRIDYRI